MLTWEDKKCIGEALGYRAYVDVGGYRRLVSIDGEFIRHWGPVEEWEGWHSYQPDVLGEVIPWLQGNTKSWFSRQEHGSYEMAAYLKDPDNPLPLVEICLSFESFSEAVCALMVAVLKGCVRNSDSGDKL